MSLFGDIFQHFRNWQENRIETKSAGSSKLPDLFAELSKPLPQFSSLEEANRFMERRQTYVAKESARQAKDFFQVTQLPSQIVFTFGREGMPDVSIWARSVTEYLIFACEGRYGSLGGRAPLQFPLPIWMNANPKLSSDTHEALLQGEIYDGDTFEARDKFNKTMNVLTPGFEPIEFKDLMHTIDRKAELEIDYPRIEYYLTAKPGVIDAIAYRIGLDLNINIKIRRAHLE